MNLLSLNNVEGLPTIQQGPYRGAVREKPDFAAKSTQSGLPVRPIPWKVSPLY
jgi:hypothetical protein